MLRQRQGGQAIVEFGLVALIFVLILFGIVDFGLLLNDWLTVSSGARDLGRSAAVGVHLDELQHEATSLAVPGVTADSPPFTQYCCNSTAALVMTVTYYNQCVAGTSGCNPVDPSDSSIHGLSNLYGGSCSSGCEHPARPSATGTCSSGPPCPGDTVRVTLQAAGAQVITPLVRLVFKCPGTAAHCYVPVGSSVVMRFEGSLLP